MVHFQVREEFVLNLQITKLMGFLEKFFAKFLLENKFLLCKY